MNAAVKPTSDEQRQAHLWICVLLLAIGLSFSAAIPPVQSPDEADHIKRAYLLTRGRIVLDAPPGNSSGGLVDTGLIAYFAAFEGLKFKAERKLSAEESRRAAAIEWSGVKAFSAAPGMAFYFPLIYIPQAIGLRMGEVFGWTVERSYYFARLLALVTTCLLLLIAFNLHAPNPLTLGLLLLPMNLFQAASASLDGVSTALAVVALSAFVRLTAGSTGSRLWFFYVLLACVSLITSSRIHLLPLWGIVLMACFRTRKKAHLAATIVCMLLVAGWLLVAITTTVGARSVAGPPTSSVALYYASHPFEFFRVLAATLTDPATLTYYRDSFIGVLGWLDTRFSGGTYFYLSLCLLLMACLSIDLQDNRTRWTARGALLACATASTVLVFFALLLAWNPHPALVIQGVQGRYFLAPALLFSYATSIRTPGFAAFRGRVAMLVLTVFTGFIIFSTIRLLIARYYQAAAA